MSTWGLTLIFDPVPSTYFRPPSNYFGSNIQTSNQVASNVWKPWLSYDEETSGNHILRQWNSRYLRQYPDFDTNLKHLVPRVENDPVLTKISTTKELMRHVIEVLLDINPSLKNFAYNRSLTASLLCSCKRTEETAIHFLFSCKIWEPRNLLTENFNLYDLTNCAKLVEFIRNCGRFE